MLALMKRNVRRAIRSLGYDIVPLRNHNDRDFANHLHQLFSFLRIDCVFDVGANLGQYRDFLRSDVLYNGPIVSFEPVQRHIAILRERSQHDRNWHVEPYALGRDGRSMPINVMESDQFSSFLAPDNTRVPMFSSLNKVTHKEMVEVRPLDHVLPRLTEKLQCRRVYLKLDTQGFDTEVLCGAEDVLPTICALQTEASVIGIYEGMPDYNATIRHLMARGFDVTGLYAVSRDESLRLIEFDCVMINRTTLSPASE